MVNVDNTVVDTGANEVLSYINVFHPGMSVRVMCAGNGALVVAV